MPRSETAKLWQERLRRFASSRMSVAQFCLSEGVSQPSYYKWRKKLRELPSDAKIKPSATSVQFMPLRLATEAADQVASESNQQAGSLLASTTIELPGGVRIRVEVPTDRQPSQRPEALA
ncbi:hypothetical protein NHH03_23540 [Stieleria sp. TO1_6]|uniref:IS66 family insertion sequence element accessory protein TnpA n=1 Tax=Stieleria tagensis TaxID=2956795 RepID=UPI00209B989B|nr:hypothetical protein [Stieleria tagensis]MCO8124731.1 hypothetical protein [Stieleria tagensis]